MEKMNVIWSLLPEPDCGTLLGPQANPIGSKGVFNN